MFVLYDKVKLLTLTLSLALLATGCNQDAIFYYISGETAPTRARIQGAPSKMVRVDTNGGDTAGGEKLYVTNGRIWEYDPSDAASRWNRFAGPEGYVVDVASTSGSSGDVLYALTINNIATRVWKNDGAGWTPLAPPSEYGFIQNIFGAGDALFATGGKRAGGNYDYAILYYDEQAGFGVVEPIGKTLLSGAGKAGSDYYLATRGSGIYKASNLAANPVVLTPVPADASGRTVHVSIAGFLQAEPDTIIGIGEGGQILHINAQGGLTVNDTTLSGTYTGALALMKIPETNGFGHLLLLGHTGSSYQHGYMELRFKLSDGTHEGTRRTPGENQPSSIQEYRQYDSSLRRYPATALWVLEPVGEAPYSVIFAATSNKGLYSYRERSDGGWQWNHEE
jgi:hypothetical protein